MLQSGWRLRLKSNKIENFYDPRVDKMAKNEKSSKYRGCSVDRKGLPDLGNTRIFTLRCCKCKILPKIRPRGSWPKSRKIENEGNPNSENAGIFTLRHRRRKLPVKYAAGKTGWNSRNLKISTTNEKSSNCPAWCPDRMERWPRFRKWKVSTTPQTRDIPKNRAPRSWLKSRKI